MFAPFKVPNFEQKILSLYKAGITLNAGALVDIDTTDNGAVGATASVAFTLLSGGSVKLATILTADEFPRELGMAIPAVNLTGPSLEERLLQLASSIMTIPVGFALAVFQPTPGDIVATDQFVGNLAGDSAATGKIDTTSTANYGKGCSVFQGRFRLKQSGEETRARYLGNTTTNGVATSLFLFR